MSTVTPQSAQASMVEVSGSTTNFQTGLRSGAFQSVDGTNNRGVSVGNVKTYVTPVSDKVTDILGENLSFAEGTFVPLNGILNTSAITPIPGFGIEFDVARILEFSCTTPFSLKVSSLSLWNQSQVDTIVGEEESGVYYAKTIHGIKILNSVYVMTSETGAVGNLNTTNIFELPFRDDIGTKLMNVLADNSPAILIENQSVTPYLVRWNFDLIPSTSQPFNNVRPQINFENSPTYSGGITFSMLTTYQIVDGYGYSLDPNFIETEDLYPNELSIVIGVKPFSEGYVSWQG